MLYIYMLYIYICYRYIYIHIYIHSFSGEYHMYQIIPLHSGDYLKKISVKRNMETDEGNS